MPSATPAGAGSTQLYNILQSFYPCAWVPQLENVSSLYTQGLTEKNLEMLPAQAQGLSEKEATAQLPQSCTLAELLSYGT